MNFPNLDELYLIERTLTDARRIVELARPRGTMASIPQPLRIRINNNAKRLIESLVALHEHLDHPQAKERKSESWIDAHRLP